MTEQYTVSEMQKEYEEYRFQRLEKISENIWLVWDKETGKLCRYRDVSPKHQSIYRCLSELEESHLPCIVQIGSGYVVEEYIDGVNLKEKLKERSFSKKEVKSMLHQLLPAIQRLHKKGIIHRDIKPSNVMVNSYGTYYLVDFDIALERWKAGKITEQEPESSRENAGTAEYAPPEQYGYQDCDARSDIYSLGVLINVLLTGHVPKEGTAKGQLGKIVRKCTRLDRGDRYQSAEELYHAVFGSGKRAVKRILIPGICAALVISGIAWSRGVGKREQEQSAGRGEKAEIAETGTAEIEIGQADYRWDTIEEYGISFPCLQEMVETEFTKGVSEKDISKVAENFTKHRKKQGEEHLYRIYYEVKDDVWVAISVLRDIYGSTGYEKLNEELLLQTEYLSYSDACNASFFYEEQYDEDTALLHAGTAGKGIWLYMEMLCPKEDEYSYREYVDFWRTSCRNIESDSGRQNRWSEYETGTYTCRQVTEYGQQEYCLEIQSIDAEQIVFSISEITLINIKGYGKSIKSTGYIRAWIVDDTIKFIGEWENEKLEGSMEPILSGNGILLDFYGEKLELVKRE